MRSLKSKNYNQSTTMLAALAVVLLVCSCDGYTPPGGSNLQTGAKLQKVAASVICAAALYTPALTSPAFARQPKQQTVRSDNSASSAFLKSEDAIAQASIQYKATDASWRDAQRDIGDSFRKITKGVVRQCCVFNSPLLCCSSCCPFCLLCLRRLPQLSSSSLASLSLSLTPSHTLLSLQYPSRL